MDKVQAINNIYSEFKLLFKEERFPELFEAIKLAQKDHFPHPLGHFAILYTPTPREARPKLMLIGNNPSWFVDVKKNKRLSYQEKKMALERVQSLENGVPSLSSYTQRPKHRFAKRLETEFKKASLINLLELTVGMNRFWVQTGSEPNALRDVILEDKISNSKKNKQLKKLIEFCNEGTKEIVEIIEPHFLIILGNPARKLLSDWKVPESISIRFAAHPDRSPELSRVLGEIKTDLELITN